MRFSSPACNITCLDLAQSGVVGTIVAPMQISAWLSESPVNMVSHTYGERGFADGVEGSLGMQRFPRLSGGKNRIIKDERGGLKSQ